MLQHQRLHLKDFVLVYTEADEEKDEKGVLLKGLDENSELSLKQFDSKQHFTQPPAHYTEASLVKTLEELGIGRPSTYAPTIYIDYQIEDTLRRKIKTFI